MHEVVSSVMCSDSSEFCTVVDRMLGSQEVLLETVSRGTPTLPVEWVVGYGVEISRYHARKAPTPRRSRTVIVHCITDTPPTLKFALANLDAMGFPIQNVDYVCTSEKKPRIHDLHFFYVVMKSARAAMEVVPDGTLPLAPWCDALYCHATRTYLHVLQLAHEGWVPRKLLCQWWSAPQDAVSFLPVPVVQPPLFFGDADPAAAAAAPLFFGDADPAAAASPPSPPFGEMPLLANRKEARKEVRELRGLAQSMPESIAHDVVPLAEGEGGGRVCRTDVHKEEDEATRSSRSSARSEGVSDSPTGDQPDPEPERAEALFGTQSTQTTEVVLPWVQSEVFPFVLQICFFFVGLEACFIASFFYF